MPSLLLLAVVGVAAQLVGGALGTGHGVISSSFLLAVGLAPATTSATVHIAEIGTSLAAGVSHWRFGNVDWRVVSRIAGPGAVGAIGGAFALSAMSTEAAAPLMSAILLCLGSYILVRFTLWGTPRGRLHQPIRTRMLAPLGLVAGFVSSTGGGGWGTISTPALLASGRMEPRKVVGSTQTSFFVIAVSSSLGFLIALGHHGIPFEVVGAIIVGGLLAAPVAAWLVRRLPSRLLGSLVGGMIVLANARIVLNADWLGAGVRTAAYVAIAVAWAAAIAWSVRAYRRERAEERAAEPEPATVHP